MPAGPRVTVAMAARGRSLSEPRVSPDGRVVAYVVRDGNGTRLCATAVDGGPELVLTTDPAPAFRGGVFDWLPDGSALVYVTGEGDLVLAPAGGGPPSVVARDVLASAVAVSPDGTRAACALDMADIGVFDLDGGRAERRRSGADFCVDPAWSPDGERLAWVEWDVPHMPWDESRIVVDGEPVAGGDGVAVQQPRWSPVGAGLAYLSDATGFLNLHLDGSPLVDEPWEHGGPVWGPGRRDFAWSPSGPAVAFTRNEAGFGRVCTVDVHAGTVVELAKGVCTSLSWQGDGVACLRSGARTPTAVAVVTADGSRPLARGPVGGFEAADLPEPVPVEWTGLDGAAVHGRVVAPRPDAPLLVWLHGGPTDQRRVEFDGRLAWFLDRGWAVLFPDHRGSTGWGRAYAQALRGQWGVVDVADAVSGIAAAVERGWGDGRRVVAMGASAGGFTVLHLLAARPGLCAAGIALYPVSDLPALAATTHRYEAHYTANLAPEQEWAARSPVTVAHRIRDPLLLLHGSDDPVVLPAQSAALAARVAGVVEHHEYEGEGHGWARPSTTEDELSRISSFLDRHVLG